MAKSSKKYRGLEKKLNLKIRQELIDQDYIKKLSKEEKEWLNKFNLEYVAADFRHEEPLHKTKKLKKKCEDSNNARNRDSYSVTKSNNMLKGMNKKTSPILDSNRSTNLREVEETLIKIIDLKDKLKRNQ